MSILVDRSTKIVIHGITRGVGVKLVENFDKNGINLVGGISAGDCGGWCAGGKVPIFDSIKSAVAAVNPIVSLIAVSSNKGYDAILEAIESNIQIIVCITGEIPIRDMVRVKTILKNKDTVLIGPNSFGVYSPGEVLLGVFPDMNTRRGKVGLLSRSNALAYEISHQIGENGLGISTAIGLGDGSVLGTNYQKLLQLFEQDPETETVIICGNLVGSYEVDAATYIARNFSKPVIIYLPGIEKSTRANYERVDKNDNNVYQRYLNKVEKIQGAGIAIADDLLTLSEMI